jgi:hypothetical protein
LLSSTCVLCTLCCQFLRIVHFWLLVRYSLMFVVLDLCPVYPMLPVSLYYPFLIARSVFCNICWVRVQSFVNVQHNIFKINMVSFVVYLDKNGFLSSIITNLADMKKNWNDQRNKTEKDVADIGSLLIQINRSCKTKYSMKTIPCTTSSLTKRMYLQRRIV